MAIRILNKSRKPVAILENAYDVGYERIINDIWTATFTLPIDDDKNAYCKPFNYVEITDDLTGEYIGLFRIIPAKTRKLSSVNEITYECEHVIATLLNDVLFRYHQRTNLTTRQNIEYILGKQSTSHWRLGSCDFTRYFHYKWENENGLLGALFSIADPFDVPYVWTWDTQTYPWTLNLVNPSERPSAEVRFGKNIASIEREVDPSNIVNRLYPLGYGEGDNQLDIKRVNGGVPYIESVGSIAEYGLQSYIWVDRRFEDEATLLASGRSFLDEWSVPKVSYKVKAVDLASLTGLSIDELTVGKLLRVTDPDVGTFNARIVGERKSDIYGAPYDIELTLTNADESIGTTLADIERRQEINEVYAQGATNMLIYPYEDNADASHPAVIRFKLPDEMVRVNKLELTFETSEFRAYSRAIEGGGAIVDSTESGGVRAITSKSGGGSSQTSKSGGGTSKSTNSGGGTSKSTESGGGEVTTSGQSTGYDQNIIPLETQKPWRPNPYEDHTHFISVNTNDWDHVHRVTIKSHTHNFSVPAHSHEFTVPAHTHDVSIPAHEHGIDLPAHKHAINLPDHTHEIEHGIFKMSTTPNKVAIKVDGTTVLHTSTSGDSIDLVPHLKRDADDRIVRGWHEVEITPNGLGRINAQLMTQFFIQSRGGVDV